VGIAGHRYPANMFDESNTAQSWTKADWEHYRLLSLAISLEGERNRIADLVFERRCDLGFSRKKLASLAGVRGKDIRQLERGAFDPRLSQLHSLFEVLGIGAHYSVD
jgi:ribosome-binding protein aMBF1 (putative translation factor)